MNETNCLKICKYIEKLWNSILMSHQKCVFVYRPDCIGHIIWSTNIISLEHAINVVKDKMHFKNAIQYFNYIKDWHMQYEPLGRSTIGKVFTMPIEQLMVLADINIFE